MRENPPNPGLWGYTGTAWGVIMGADDSKTMQRVDVRALNGEMILEAERPQSWAFSSVPPLPSENGAKGAEVTLIFRGGDRAHPIIVNEGDRRPGYRPKNLKPGESKHFDDQGQYSHIARGGHIAVAKNHSITAGDKPEAATHEFNDQLKGVEARLNHLEHSHAGLFDFVSQLNTLAIPKVPALQALAPVLNQNPTGLTLMTQAIQGKFQSYLQQHIQDAMAKFLSPTIGGIGSLMGGQDTVIAALQAKILGLISANPVVKQVDDLTDELAALRASASPAVASQMAPMLQGLIDSATAGNPIVGQVAQLRGQLAGLISAAGDGLNFLGPQQRIPQRLSRSLSLTR